MGAFSKKFLGENMRDRLISRLELPFFALGPFTRAARA
jgi:hypothetical protein